MSYRAILDASYCDNMVAAIRYNANPGKVARFLDGLDVGVAVGKPRHLAEALMFNHHNPDGWQLAVAKKRRLKKGKRLRGVPHAGRSFIVSVQTPPGASIEVLTDIDDRLERVFFDLKRKLGVPTLGWIHRNTKTRHLHILLPNSDGENALNIGPRMLSDLQSFDWTRAFESGRGHGKTRGPHVKVYAKAKKIKARDLAILLLDEHGQVRPERWDDLVATGAITDLSYLKDGSLRSFVFEGRRMRLTTLQAYVSEQQQQPKEPTMNQYLDPTQPVPKTLQEELLAAGFTPDDLAQLQANLGAVHASLEAERQELRAKNKNRGMSK